MYITIGNVVSIGQGTQQGKEKKGKEKATASVSLLLVYNCLLSNLTEI